MSQRGTSNYLAIPKNEKEEDDIISQAESLLGNSYNKASTASNGNSECEKVSKFNDLDEANAEIKRLNSLLGQRINMQEIMKNEIKTLQEEKTQYEKSSKPATNFYGLNTPNGLNWHEKYAELIQVLKIKLNI